MREGELGRLSWTAATIDEHPESEEKGEDGRSRLRTWINMCRGGAVLPSNTLSDEAFIEGTQLRSPTSMSGGPQACKNAGTWRDTAWRVLNSDAWAVILIALTTLLALFRPICWFISRGQTFGGEMRAARGDVFLGICFLHLCNSAAYHTMARHRLKAPAQRAVLNKLLTWEIIGAAVGALLFIAMGLVDIQADEAVSQKQGGGPRTHFFGGFEGTCMPATGLLAMPMLVLSFMTPARKKIVPKIGDDVFSFSWFQKSLVLSLITGAVGIMFFMALGVLMIGRYAEYGFGSEFSPRILYEVEAKLAATQLVSSSPLTTDDIEDFAREYVSTGAPVRLASAEMTLSTGERLFWESTDLARGVVARVVEVLLPQGVFLFSTDPMLTAMAVWDPILAALFAIACAAFFRVSTTATGALVVSPLEKMLSALVEAAAVLDAKGRVAKRAAEERLMVGDAVKRILAHMVISSGPTLRLTNSSSDDSGSDSPSPRKGPQTAVQGSILAPSPQQKGSILASSPQHKGSILLGSATGSAAPLRLSAPSDPSAKANGAPNSLAWMRESTPSGVEKSPPSMRFTPSVLNKLGSPAWNPRTFRDSELIPACHLIYIKTRIPDRVCPKERFVAFAERALERHPEMGFHNRRRALASMHAAYSLLRTPDFAGLGSLRSLAVLVSSLCMDLCSVGRDDDDLCAEGHPLAVTYLYHRPQKHAAVAEVYRIASESDCNIFAALSPADVAKLREYIRSCVFATSDDALNGLTNQLILMKSQLAISAAEASARHPDGADSSSRHRKERKEQSISRRKQVDRASLGLHSLLATGEVSPIGVSAPDLAMQAAVALSASHHAWSGSARWCLEEQHLVRQAVDALRGTVNSNVEGAAKTQELQRRRRERWESLVHPFMQALWAVCPSVEGMASQVADIVSQTDCSAPTPAGTQPAQVEDAPSPDS